MALRSLKDRLQKLEDRKPEHLGGDHSVENSATYEFTDWTCEIGRIQRGGSRPQDWLELIQSVESGQFTSDRAQQLYISNLCAEALKSIPDAEKKTLQYANLLIHCASLRGQQSIDDAREMFQDARYDAKKFAIVHIAAAQFELSLGNRDKAKKILDRAKSLHAEPLSLITKAFTNLVYGHPQLLDHEELEAQEKENNLPVPRPGGSSTPLLMAKHSKDGYNSVSSGHSFSRDLTNITHILPNKDSSKARYLLSKPSREAHHGNQAQGFKSDHNAGEVLSRANKEGHARGQERTSEAQEGQVRTQGGGPGGSRRTQRVSESSDDSSNLTQPQKHVFKPPMHITTTGSSWKFKTPVSEQKPALSTDKDHQTGLDDSVIAFNFKRERNTSGNASDDTDSNPVTKETTYSLAGGGCSTRGERESVSSSSKKLRSYHSTPDCKKSSFLSMPSGSSTGHLFSRKKLNIGKAQRVPKRTSLPQVTEGKGDSEDEDSLKMKPLPVYSPDKVLDSQKHNTDVPERFGSIDSDSGIFASIENLTKDILAFVEEPKKLETNESRVFTDVNHNGDFVLETQQEGLRHNGPISPAESSQQHNKIKNCNSNKYNVFSHDSAVPEVRGCQGDSCYKSVKISEDMLEPKQSCNYNNRSVMDASQGTLLGTAEFCPKSETLVENGGQLYKENGCERSKVKCAEREAGNNVQTTTKGEKEIVVEKGPHAGHEGLHGNQQVPGLSVQSAVVKQSCSQQPMMSSLPQQQMSVPSQPMQVPVAQVTLVPQLQQQQQPQMMMPPVQNTKLLWIKDQCYTIIRQMGSGGSSKVYEVQDQDFNRLAVKCVNFDGADDLAIESYMNEIELLDRLQYSKAIIKLYAYEYKNSDNTLYVVMEKGERDLANFFRSRIKEGNMSQELLSYYWKEMLRAVQVLHKEGIVHSDLKPANFLMVSGELKLIDFGIAKAIQPDMTSVTRENQVGTLNYMSPETILDTCSDMQRDEQGRVKSKFKIGVKSDVWSLGCILHLLAYRKTPFQHITNLALKLNAITNDKVEIVLQPHENKEIMSVIKKCLLRDPKKRPSIEELLETPLLVTKT